ncbi:hypothetical protein [Yoonia sp. 2307UL14-13]|uniref:hypothetical protein n=1 Tax=Yoonia sp. 2307UL14-13 TaxID=3126506 RepID=UPI00309EE177
MLDMENAYRNNWFEDLARYIEGSHSGHIGFLGTTSSDVRELIKQTWRYFSQRGIKRRSDMMQLCVIGLAVGGRFYEDPRFPVLVDFSTREMPPERVSHIFALRLEKSRKAYGLQAGSPRAWKK